MLPKLQGLPQYTEEEDHLTITEEPQDFINLGKTFHPFVIPKPLMSLVCEVQLNNIVILPPCLTVSSPTTCYNYR